jgi:O-antigen ligase
MDRLVSSRWFALADLILVLGCGAIWIAWPAAGGWPILIALLPWAVRLAAGLFPFQKSILDFPIIAFLLTAGVGVWAAYDREAALVKFWILISAVLLYYALAGQPKANLRILTGLFGAMGVCIAAYFLLSQDWSINSRGDFSWINRIWTWIILSRPALSLWKLPPNQAGGLLVLLLPFTLAFVLDSWKKHKRCLIVIAVLCATVMVVGLILTSSRGAWLALLVGMGIWGIWWLCERITGGEIRKAGTIFGVVLAGLLILGLVGVMLTPGGVLGLTNRLPGLPDGGSRLNLAKSALQLISDFPLTGGGLRSFPGLYSQYIMVTPFLLFEYSHNFMLDVALEQSVFGWLAIVLIFGISFIFLVKFIAGSRRDSELRIFAEATLTGILVVVLHGLVDDALYGDAGNPLLFLLPGMAIGIVKFSESHLVAKTNQRNFQKWLVLGGVTFVMIGFGVVALRKPLLGIWHATWCGIM